MALTKEQRDALPDDEFAVPGKRKLPIPDEKHVRMGWDMVDQAKGLTDEERREARSRILDKAHQLGIDTTGWNRIKAMRLSAMSLDVPEVEDHPNRVPFSGVLTYLDRPSDFPPDGSKGKLVVMTAEAAEKALPSLLGMAVDFTDDFDGHDPVQKFGIITAANIEGDAIVVEGFMYGSDFPEQVEYVQAHKDDLGFSYEVQRASVASLDDDPLVIESFIFTGAAILKKDKAAYSTTSLAAKAKEERKMDEETLKALGLPADATDEQIKEAVSAMHAKADRAEKAEQELEQAKLNAGSVAHLVKPHADRIRAAADSLEAAGMGAHEKRGHVRVLRNMADKMEADAMMGKLPHIYDDDTWMYAGREQNPGEQGQGEVKFSPEAQKVIDGLSAQVAELSDKVTAAGKAEFNAAAQPERQTLPPHVTAILAKAGIDQNPKDGEKKTFHEVDQMLAAAGITGPRAMEAKLNMRAAGMIAA